MLLVTRPAKINHLSAITLSSIFTNIFHLECSIPFLKAAEESPLNSTVVMKILL